MPADPKIQAGMGSGGKASAVQRVARVRVHPGAREQNPIFKRLRTKALASLTALAARVLLFWIGHRLLPDNNFCDQNVGLSSALIHPIRLS